MFKIILEINCFEDLVFVSLVRVGVNNINLGSVNVIDVMVFNIEVGVFVFDGVGGLLNLVLV